MTETTTVYYADTNGADSYHFYEHCPHLEHADGETRTTALYHSRRVGNPAPVQERHCCSDCRRTRATGRQTVSTDSSQS